MDICRFCTVLSKILCCHVKMNKCLTKFCIYQTNVHKSKWVVCGQKRTRWGGMIKPSFCISSLWDKSCENSMQIRLREMFKDRADTFQKSCRISLILQSIMMIRPKSAPKCTKFDARNLFAAAPSSTLPLRTRQSVSRRRRPPRGRSWGFPTSLSRLDNLPKIAFSQLKKTPFFCCF